MTLALNLTLLLAEAARNANVRNALLTVFDREVNRQIGRAFTAEQASVLTTLSAALR